MLYNSDFKTIWEIAYRWEGLEPPMNQPQQVPEPVTENIYRISWAFLRKKFPLRIKSGRRVFEEEGILDLLIFNRARNRIIKCLSRQIYPRDFLDSLYVLRGDLMKWCEDEFIQHPEFWKEREFKPLIGRHKNQEIDKQLCQAIARTLWNLDPSIHPAHMVRGKAIRTYGNGAHYVEDTVKEWISEHDPQSAQRKTGRPPASDYLIDLEKGVLKSEIADSLGTKANLLKIGNQEKTDT